MSSKSIYRFYIYAYIRSHDSKNGKAGTPYYIGKGSNDRAYAKHGKLPVPKDISKIVFLETNLSNIGALALERRYISWYGRLDLKTGCLRNKTDGGEGGQNVIYSAETRSKMSKSAKGKILSVEHKQKISNSLKGRPSPTKGKPLSDDHKAKMSATTKGTKRSLEIRKKLSLSKMGKLNPNYGKSEIGLLFNKTSTCVHCGITTNVGNINRWHGDKCKYKT